jgi:hypothetical protein
MDWIKPKSFLPMHYGWRILRLGVPSRVIFVERHEIDKEAKKLAVEGTDKQPG